jgi:hypothetical protein
VLSSLAGIEKEARAPFLASLIESLLPEASASTPQEALARDVLEELSKRGTKRDRAQPPNRARLLDELTKELSETLLGPTGASEARDRLGQRGDLSPASYTVRFTNFADLARKEGVRRRYVEEAMRTPDSMQHLRLDSSGFPGATLVAKRVLDTAIPHVLLVIAKRVEATMEIHDALRVPLALLPKDKLTAPLELLRLMIERYGLPFNLGQPRLLQVALGERGVVPHGFDVGEQRLLYVDERVPQLDRESFVARVLQPDPEVSCRTIIISNLQPREVFVTLAYTLNETLYRREFSVR